MNPPFDFRQLRRQVFAHPWPIDPFLTQTGYYFLKNPGGQLPYLYLSQYVREFCRAWFGTPPEELELFDWGCGKGQFTYLLQQASLKVTSADVTPNEGERILGRPTLPLEHPYLLPFGDQSFDVVLSVGVLEHVPQEVESLREIYRVLKPNGLFFCFNLPYQLSWVQWTAWTLGNKYHDRFYGRRKTRRMLGAQNFEVLDMWQRQLFPKNRLWSPAFRHLEALDQWLVDHTPLRFFATSLEFVAAALHKGPMKS